MEIGPPYPTVTSEVNGQRATASSSLQITSPSTVSRIAPRGVAVLLHGQAATYQVSLASTNAFGRQAKLAVSTPSTGMKAAFISHKLPSLEARLGPEEMGIGAFL